MNDLLLAGRSCDHAVTTVGALGAVYSDHRAHYEISAPPLPHPFRSDACAGDSLVAAITYHLAAGGEPLRACEFGVAAAAATVQLPGTDVFDRAGDGSPGPAGPQSAHQPKRLVRGRHRCAASAE